MVDESFDQPNGTLLASIAPWIMSGGAPTEYGKFMVQDGALRIAPLNATLGSMASAIVETGDRAQLVEIWLDALNTPPRLMAARVDENSYLALSVSNRASGIITVNAYVNGAAKSMASNGWRLPIPLAEDAVLAIRVARDGTFQVLLDGIAYAPSVGTARSVTSDVPLKLPTELLAGTKAGITHSQYGTVYAKRVRVTPLSTALDIASVNISPIPGGRRIDVRGFYLGNPENVMIGIGDNSGNPIVARDEAVTLLDDGAFTASRIVSRVPLSSHDGAPIRVSACWSNDPTRANEVTITAPRMVDQPVRAAAKRPFPMGMNSDFMVSWGPSFLTRDMGKRGRWVQGDGPGKNQSLPSAYIDRETHFPSAYPAGCTQLILLILEGAPTGPIPQHIITYPVGMTATIQPTSDVVIDQAPAAGTAKVSFPGVARRGLSIALKGPIPAGKPQLTMLPTADAHPERLYSDEWAGDIQRLGIDVYRPMTGIGANNYSQELDLYTISGTRAGLPRCNIATIRQAANDLGFDPWINTHAALPTSFAAALASSCALYLGADRIPFFEFSNEPWNQAFVQSFQLAVEGYLAGKHTPAGDAGPQPALFGHDPRTTDQPFEPNYQVGPKTFWGRTTVDIPRGARIFGNIYGAGWQVFEALADVPAGTAFSPSGDANFLRVVGNGDILRGQRRQYADRSKEMWDTVLAEYAAAGITDPGRVQFVLNIQSGGGASVAIEMLDWAGLWGYNFRVATAPYWGGNFFNLDMDLGEMLDEGFRRMLDAANDRAAWCQSVRQQLQAAAKARGYALPDDVSIIYEVNHHLSTTTPAYYPLLQAYRRDRRMGAVLKFFAMKHGAQNAGATFTLFSDVAADRATGGGWGVSFYQGESGAANPENPETIALLELEKAWNEERPGYDLFTPTHSREGTGVCEVIKFGPIDQATSVQIVTNGAGPNPISASDVTGGVLPVIQTVTFAPGEYRKTVPLPYRIDGEIEPDESAVTGLANPSGNGFVGTLSAAIAVTVSDPLPAA